jgi:predicted dehydrogenase/D-arabinose 1-dehydrogenase-like Zn-dependent alcohol dehydrogenase|tara:strand:- start:12934 stop:15012 length:2079 start_codon:yes stop_codon:yes gene_type:complete
MKVLAQDLKTGKTDILEVPSPAVTSDKIRVLNEYSLISTGSESSIVNFGRASWINKARQQPDRVKDVINKIKSSGLSDTYRAIKNKLNYPMQMGYAAVGTVSHARKIYNLPKGTRVFTNSFHQEEALVDYNMCVRIPKNLDNKSASFGAIGGIAMQSIKCVPEGSKIITLIGLGLLGQVTLRILNALGYQCIVYDIDLKKIELAEKYGAIGIRKNNITEEVLNYTKGKGSDCTIIAAASLSSDIVNEATNYTKRKGKIISSGLVGLNLIREKFFKKQIEFVVSNSSGNKNHRDKGSSYENINHFFELLSSKKVEILDLISEEISLNNSNNIYSFPNNSTFFSKLIKYETTNINMSQTFSDLGNNKQIYKIKTGLIGAGNFAMSTLIPAINNSKEGYLSSVLGREGFPLYVAKKRFTIDTITTNESDFYKNINAVFITTPHETHFTLLSKAIEFSLSAWIEKPLVISNEELIDIMKKMLSNKLVYAIGYNRSLAPWTNFMKNKINSRKTNISMTINAGKLPLEHWLLNEKACGGRIIGEFCHFTDLTLTLLGHTDLINIECISRDRYYQDTGHYAFHFQDGSTANINYRHDLPASVPKEKIIIKTPDSKHINNNWKNFSNGQFFNNKLINKGKGHDEAIASFFQKIKNNNFSTKNEIHQMCFSTFTTIKLQKMSQGEIINIQDCYKDEILSKS